MAGTGGGKFIKGALIEFMPTFLVPVPNVVVFQYNPETMQHRWNQAQAAGGANPGAAAASPRSNPLAVRGLPGESFSFTLALDATDDVAEGNPIAVATGVYSRLAALEMLLYPVPAGGGGGLLGSVSVGASAGGISAAAGGAAAAAPTRTIPQSQVPTVLFVWGPGRIVPVRVTSLNITEKLYDAFLSPTHAEAQIELKVLTPEELRAVTGPLGDLSRIAYTYSQGLRQALAAANLAHAGESVIGMLPV
jgi:hypothetical protein